jgi:Bacterial pre-peptidase C-terminal domain
MSQDNNFAKARNVGALNGLNVFRDSVGRKDKNDFYTFTLNRSSNFSLNLSQLKSDVNVALIQGGQTILKSARSGKKSEAIATTLSPGTYHVRVYPGRSDSKYRLKLSASPVVSIVSTGDSPLPDPSPSGGGSDTPPIVSTFTTRLLSTSASEIGSIDPTTGVFSPLANTSTSYNDIASAPNGDLFGVSFNSLYKVDPVTGTSSRVGSLGTSTKMESLAFTSSGNLYAAGNSEFYSINTETGAASLVANIPGFDSSGDLLYDDASGRFLATSDAPYPTKDFLYSIGINGDATLVGNVGFYDVWGLAIANGTLYGYTSNRLQIIINPTTGVGTFDRAVTGTASQIYGAT